jgi:hypothetical protein
MCDAPDSVDQVLSERVRQRAVASHKGKEEIGVRLTCGQNGTSATVAGASSNGAEFLAAAAPADKASEKSLPVAANALLADGKKLF